MSINIGLINFTNCLPINYTLEKWALENLILSWGNPAAINQLMKDGQVQIAPISTFEYLQNQDDYVLIKEACITSDAECGSVILFSNCKFEDLGGKSIALPHDSATSINMLKVLLNELLSPTPLSSLSNIQFMNHKYEKPLSEALGKDFDAALYIGDNALISSKREIVIPHLMRDLSCDESLLESQTGKMLKRVQHDKKEDPIFQYDLGRMWKDLTGLPPVFGSWVANADWADKHKDDFEQIKFIIDKAVEDGLGVYFNEVVEKAALNLNLNSDFIKDYLTAKIKYNFTSEHEKSLNLFKELLIKLKSGS